MTGGTTVAQSGRAPTYSGVAGPNPASSCFSIYYQQGGFSRTHVRAAGEIYRSVARFSFQTFLAAFSPVLCQRPAVF